MVAREERAIDEYNAAKREQEGQEDKQRAVRREAADRRGITSVTCLCPAPDRQRDQSCYCVERCCRIYERLKAEREAETAEREEEDFLVDLMRAEEAAERERAEAAARAARRETAKAEMIAANQLQMRLKVRSHHLLL